MNIRRTAHRSPTRALIAGLTALAGACMTLVPAESSAQVVGCAKDDANPNRLLVIDDAKTLKPHELRTFSGKVVESETSPKGTIVGALVADAAAKTKGLWTFTFHAVDAKGKTVAQVKNAQGFSFSPDDRYVAVTTGRPYEGGSGFWPEGTQIVDLRTKKQWSVPELKDATEVDWTDLPGEGLTLMAKKPTGRKKIWKYLIKNRRAAATDWKGLHFSPDGKYYYLTPREAIDQGMCKPGDKSDSCMRAFTRAGKRVRLNLKKRFRRAIGWTGRNGHELAVSEGLGKDEEGMEIDLASGRMNVVKERVNRRWKLRRGIRLVEEGQGKKARLRLKANRLFDRLKERQQQRKDRRKKRGY